MASPGSASRPSLPVPRSDLPLTEDGLGTLEVPHFPLARTFDEIMDALERLYTDEHGYRSVVIDSVDWLEPLVWQRACKDNRWASIEDAGYGKGYIAALDLWRQYLDALDALRGERGMTVVQIAHTDIKRFDSPEHEPYDRYVIKLHARASLAAGALGHRAVRQLPGQHGQGRDRLQQEGDPRLGRRRAAGLRQRAPGLPRQEPLRPAGHAAPELMLAEAMPAL